MFGLGLPVPPIIFPQKNQTTIPDCFTSLVLVILITITL